MTEGSRSLLQVLQNLFAKYKNGMNTLIGKVIDIRESKAIAEDGQEYELLSSHRQPAKGDIAVFVKTVDGFLYALTGIHVEKVGRLTVVEEELLANLRWAFRTMQAGLFGVGYNKTDDDKYELVNYITADEEKHDILTYESLPNLVTSYFEIEDGSEIFFNSKHIMYYVNNPAGQEMRRTSFSGKGTLNIVKDSELQTFEVNLSQPSSLYCPSVTVDNTFAFIHNKTSMSIYQSSAIFRLRVNTRRVKYSKTVGAIPKIKIRVRVTQTGASQKSGNYYTPCFVAVESVEKINFDYPVDLTGDLEPDDRWKIDNYYPMTAGPGDYPCFWKPHPFSYNTTSTFENSFKKFSFNVETGSLDEIASGTNLLCKEADKNYGGVVIQEVIKPNYFNSDTFRSGDRVYTHVIRHGDETTGWVKTYEELYNEFGFPKLFVSSPQAWRVDIAPQPPEILAIDVAGPPYTSYANLLASKNIFEFDQLIGSGFNAVIVGGVSLQNFQTSGELVGLNQSTGVGAWVGTCGEEEFKVQNRFNDGSVEEIFSEKKSNCVQIYMDIGGWNQYNPLIMGIGYEADGFAHGYNVTANDSNIVHAKVARSVGLGGNAKTPVLNNCTFANTKGLFTAVMVPPEYNSVKVTLDLDFLVFFSESFTAGLQDEGLFLIRLMSLAITESDEAYFVVECTDSINNEELTSLVRSVQFTSYANATTTQHNSAKEITRQRKFIVGMGVAERPEFLGAAIRISEEEIIVMEERVENSIKLKFESSGAAYYDDDNFKINMDYYLLKQPVDFLVTVLPEFNAEFGPIFVHMGIVPSGDDKPILLYCDKNSEDDEKYIQKAIILEE